jgi:hypothetical protein
MTARVRPLQGQVLRGRAGRSRFAVESRTPEDADRALRPVPREVRAGRHRLNCAKASPIGPKRSQWFEMRRVPDRAQRPVLAARSGRQFAPQVVARVIVSDEGRRRRALAACGGSREKPPRSRRRHRLANHRRAADACASLHARLQRVAVALSSSSALLQSVNQET